MRFYKQTKYGRGGIAVYALNKTKQEQKENVFHDHYSFNTIYSRILSSEYDTPFMYTARKNNGIIQSSERRWGTNLPNRLTFILSILGMDLNPTHQYNSFVQKYTSKINVKIAGGC